MTDEIGEPEQPAAKALRGQAAYQANLDKVSARNDAAKKAGAQARKKHEAQAEASRRAVDMRDRKRMVSRTPGSSGTGKAYLRGDR